MAVQQQTTYDETSEEQQAPPLLNTWYQPTAEEKSWIDKLSYAIVPLSCLAIILANIALGLKLCVDTYYSSYASMWPYHLAFMVVFCGTILAIEHILTFSRK